MSPRQFEVFTNPSPTDQKSRPYVLVLQHEFLSDFKTQLVAPLVAPGYLRPVPRLNPEFEIEGRKVYFSPTEITVWPAHILRDRIESLFPMRDVLIAALDLVFTGI